MQCVTAVDGHWLAELGPMFFTVKESTATRFVSSIANSLTPTFVYIIIVTIDIVPVYEIQN